MSVFPPSYAEHCRLGPRGRACGADGLVAGALLNSGRAVPVGVVEYTTCLDCCVNATFNGTSTSCVNATTQHVLRAAERRVIYE